MAELDISQTTTPTTIKDFTVDSETTDGVSENTDSFHDNEDFERFFGKYLNTAKIKMAINAYANWVVGLGWTTKDNEVEIELDHIIGW